MSDIAAAVDEVRARIAAAARSAGREPDAVRLVAATKTVPADRVAEAVALGVRDVGENRAQELLAKADALTGAPGPVAIEVCWHFLGRLQRNKVRSLAGSVTWWQSVDREALGVAIARHAPGARVLVEVNLGGEPQKGGCAPTEAGRLVDALRGLGLRVEGLMTIPPAGDDPRRWFAALRELGDDLGVDQLSMGMTDDYEAAVQEGATMVRVGRAIFGARR
ncbi:MAG TPA: YggS family pyridoxal phosphate-dependent enzyme [Acidimicrobiia bacterium]|nr:YggS family pyridoxal phosphate-dependent enzyme [Acidimicrobiia bacterium]